MIFVSPNCTEPTGSTMIVSKRGFLRRAAISSTTGMLLSQLTGILSAKEAWSRGQDSNKLRPRWKFVFVNHAITNPFFEATQNGIKDACELVGCAGFWLGSRDSNLSEMVAAFNSAIASKADAIGVSLIDKTVFDRPVEEALRAGIPVFAYNSDVPPESQNRRLAYIGQDLYGAGYMLGYRLANAIPPGKIAAFMATKRTLNIQPRADGLKDAIRDSGRKDIDLLKDADSLPWFESGSEFNQQMEVIRRTYLGHPDVKAMVGLDGGSTQSVAEVMSEFRGMSKAKDVQAAGFDLLPRTLQLLQQGYLDFTIDQQPYLQGFLTTIEMFLFLISGGMVGPADINTGRELVTIDNVELYLTRPSRYEGNSPAGWAAAPVQPIRVLKQSIEQSVDGKPRCALGLERTMDARPEMQ
jgi:simple sugar transport system substrate-binding protein